ncbi:hypothetical protein RB195_012266 [Necator americanus]|uniref:Uncharacterized protein n=1 Tax=Necator americanus TaxID=51031 RepID=A0ABR1D748_NECAM
MEESSPRQNQRLLSVTPGQNRQMVGTVEEMSSGSTITTSSQSTDGRELRTTRTYDRSIDSMLRSSVGVGACVRGA